LRRICGAVRSQREKIQARGGRVSGKMARMEAGWQWRRGSCRLVIQ